MLMMPQALQADRLLGMMRGADAFVEADRRLRAAPAARRDR